MEQPNQWLPHTSLHVPAGTRHGAAARRGTPIWPSRAALHVANGSPVVQSIPQLQFPELWKLVLIAIRIGDGEDEERAGVLQRWPG